MDSCPNSHDDRDGKHFCGECGVAITPVAPPGPQAAPPRLWCRKRSALVTAGVLAVLLIGVMFSGAAAALTGARAEASKKWPNPDYEKIVDALKAQRGLLVCHPAGYPTDWEPAPGTGTAYEAARIKVARGTPTACEEFLQLYATITVDTYKSEKALTAAVKQTRTNQEGDFAWRWDPTVITLEGGDPAIQNSVVGAMKALPGKEKRLYGHNPFADRA